MADKDKIVGTDKFWDPEMIFTNYEPEEEEKDIFTIAEELNIKL